MSKPKLINYSLGRVLISMSFSDCWTLNSKPIFFRVKKLKMPSDLRNWIGVSFVIFYMVAIWIGYDTCKFPPKRQFRKWA